MIECAYGKLYLGEVVKGIFGTYLQTESEITFTFIWPSIRIESEIFPVFRSIASTV